MWVSRGRPKFDCAPRRLTRVSTIIRADRSPIYHFDFLFRSAPMTNLAQSPRLRHAEWHADVVSMARSCHYHGYGPCQMWTIQMLRNANNSNEANMPRVGSIKRDENSTCPRKGLTRNDLYRLFQIRRKISRIGF